MQNVYLNSLRADFFFEKSHKTTTHWHIVILSRKRGEKGQWSMREDNIKIAEMKIISFTRKTNLKLGKCKRHLRLWNSSMLVSIILETTLGLISKSILLFVLKT